MNEFIIDIQKENWKYFYCQQDIQNTNPYAQFVLARGQFKFDSIAFNTGWHDAIRLYNSEDPDEHFLFIGSNSDKKDNQVAYVHKEKVLSTTFNSIRTSYIVHFVNTNQTVRFNASNE